MKRLENKEIKNILLEMLKAIDDFCISNQLNYYVCGGTLIGAVRHNGFIPWDDDIDITMPRKDYEFFIRNFHVSHYRAMNYAEDEDYFYSFAKVIDTQTTVVENNALKLIRGLGVYIDVFPLDGMPDNALVREVYYHWVHLLNRMMGYAKLEKTDKKINGCMNRALSCISHLFGANRLYHRNIKTVMPFGGKKTDYSFVSNGCYGKKDIYYSEDVMDSKRHAFENIYVNVPCGYDRLLSNIYGNYLEMPPVEKRSSKHGMECYLK